MLITPLNTGRRYPNLSFERPERNTRATSAPQKKTALAATPLYTKTVDEVRIVLGHFVIVVYNWVPPTYMPERYVPRILEKQIAITVVMAGGPPIHYY